MRRVSAAIICLVLLLTGCGNTKKDAADFGKWLNGQHYGTAGPVSEERDDLFGLPKDVRSTLQVTAPLTPDTLRTIGADLARQSARHPWILAVSDGSRTAEVTTSSRDNERVLTDVEAIDKIPDVRGFQVIAPDSGGLSPLTLTTDRDHLIAVTRAAPAADSSRTVRIGDGTNTVSIARRDHLDAMLRTIEPLLPYATVNTRDWETPVVRATTDKDAGFTDALAALRSTGGSFVSFEVVRGRVSAVRAATSGEATTALRIGTVSGVSQVRLDDPTLIQTDRRALDAVVAQSAALPGRVTVEIPRPAGTTTVTPTTPPVCSFSGAGSELAALTRQAAWCDRTELDYVAVTPDGFQFNPRDDQDPAPAVAAIRAVPWQGSRAVTICVRTVCLDFRSTATGRAQQPSVRARPHSGSTPSPGDDAIAQTFRSEWDRTATS